MSSNKGIQPMEKPQHFMILHARNSTIMDTKSPPRETLQSPRPSFFDLPTEIRIQIYRLLLASSKGKSNLPSYYSMSLTCRSIYSEALPVFLKESSFEMSTFGKFLWWAMTGKPQNIELVHHLSLRMSLHCLAQVSYFRNLPVEPLAISPQGRSTRANRDDESVASRLSDRMERIATPGSLKVATLLTSVLGNNYQSLRNLQTIHLNIGDYYDRLLAGDSVSDEQEQVFIFEAISFMFPNILSFTFFTDVLSNASLERFHKLRHLCFRGYSRSTPEETLSVLRSLKSLESLSFEEHPHQRLRDIMHYRKDQSPLAKNLSINPEVLSQMNPLKFFRIGPYHNLRSSPCTLGMIEALYAHSSTLQCLEINIKNASDAASSKLVKAVLKFVSATPIRDYALNLTLKQNMRDFRVKLLPGNRVNVDCFKWVDERIGPIIHLEIRAGKYFPPPSIFLDRKRSFHLKRGHYALYERN